MTTPQIEYETPRGFADGTAPVPEADALVYENHSPAELFRFFQTPQQVLSYFFAAKRRQFAERNASRRCVVCAVQRVNVGLATVSWKVSGRSLRMAGHVNGSTHRRLRTADTALTMCATCHRTWRRELRRLNALGRVGVGIAVLGFVGNAVASTFMPESMLLNWPSIAFVGFVITGLLLAGKGAARRDTITPPAVRVLMPEDVHCQGVGQHLSALYE